MSLKLNWLDKIIGNKKPIDYKAVVLMYHRVANVDYDPWQIAVTPEIFEQQLQVLKENYNIIPVIELISALGQRNLSANSVCITFDDGYEDNYSAAKPLLEKYQCPTTFFISTHYIEQQSPFWWDELKELILSTEKLPPILNLNLGKTKFCFRLEDDCILTEKHREEQRNWIWNEKPPIRRCELYMAAWALLRTLVYPEIKSALEEIKLWAASEDVSLRDILPMTKIQLYEIAKHPLFEAALHTVSHPYLSFHKKDSQTREIVENKQTLINICGKISESLAYPFGNFNRDTLSVVRKQKLKAAFTTKEELITDRSDIYRLGRFQVKNWRAEEFKQKLAEWMRG